MVIRKAEFRQEYLTQANKIVSLEEKTTPNDGYPLCDGFFTGTYTRGKPEWGPLGAIVSMGALECANLFGKEFNKIWFEAWVNVVRPVRRQRENRHNHVEINRYLNKPLPNYTWVYYLQMPDIVYGDEGKLEVEELSGETIKYLPTVGDMVILNGNEYHSIYSSPNSTVNRVVLAGNVAFENSKTKRSLM